MDSFSANDAVTTGLPQAKKKKRVYLTSYTNTQNKSRRNYKTIRGNLHDLGLGGRFLYMMLKA